MLAYKNQGIIPCKDNEIKEFPNEEHQKHSVVATGMDNSNEIWLKDALLGFL